ncbi:DUF4062 domain-containing protein [Vibrio cholerae]|uniref:DUF4062 domain-containing protein n=1 Tax=Vibrio cholerae TaxID=666 RepID=UPI0010FE3D39|nr:DUF4062 domain-containing protein [Vibrio cholerae]TLE15118.1 DUF4062 domain-containing protein [Vibrio cholerae]TLE23686.1 DUF4062 domain-containing protein [Vibrio cholerae]
MAKPRIFVSSTYFDLKQVRSDLERFIHEQGYDPVLNEKGHISYGSQEKLEEYCYKEIKQCDILVSIIGGRYGSQSHESEYSVSNKELKKALEEGKQVYIFIDSAVATEYRTYQINKDNKEIKYASVDDVKVYEFLEEVYDLPKNNTIHNFNSAEDITTFLLEQWAGLFQRLLNDESKKKEVNLINKLSSTSEILNSLVEYLVEEKKNGESAISNILMNNHPIFNELQQKGKIGFRVFFETADELADLLKGLRFVAIGKDDPFRKEGYVSWEFPENSIEYLRISKKVFNYPPKGEEIDPKKLKLIPMTPQEWKEEYIEVEDIF